MFIIDKLSNPIHILHIATALSWRGGEQQLAYLYEELNQQSVKQVIVCSQGSELEAYCKATHKQCIALPKKISLDFLFAHQLKKISRQGYSIIHVHDSHAHSLAVLSALFFGNNLPIVMSRRVDFTVGSHIFSSFKYNYSRIKKIICVSDAIKKIMAASIKDQDKLVTIYDGIDVRNFNQDKKAKLRKEFNIATEEYMIGNVAALAPHKDYVTFINTACVLINRGLKAKFLMIGEGGERKKLEQYIQQKGLSNHIIMTGFRKDVKEIVAELDVFLMTSETEGLGSSILDAMASGVMVVATEAGGIPEVVIHNKTGLLSPVKDVHTLANQVEHVLHHPDVKEKMIAQAKEAVKKFSKENMASLTLQIYKEVISKA